MICFDNVCEPPGDAFPPAMARFWSYTGNLIGSLGLVAMIFGSGMFATNPLPEAMAVMKTSLPLGQVCCVTHISDVA